MMLSSEIYKFFKTAILKKHQWPVASAFALLLSSYNLLTGYEQLSHKQFNKNLSTFVLQGKIDSSSIRSSIKIYQFVLSKQNNDPS